MGGGGAALFLMRSSLLLLARSLARLRPSSFFNVGLLAALRLAAEPVKEGFVREEAVLILWITELF